MVWNALLLSISWERPKDRASHVLRLIDRREPPSQRLPSFSKSFAAPLLKAAIRD
jgi:hypothetical protein